MEALLRAIHLDGIVPGHHRIYSDFCEKNWMCRTLGHWTRPFCCGQNFMGVLSHPFFLNECRLGIHSKIGHVLEVHATQLNDLDVAHLRLGLIGEIEGFFCCLNVVFFMIFFPIYPGSTGTVHRYIHHTHVHIKVFFDIQIFVIYIHPNTS